MREVKKNFPKLLGFRLFLQKNAAKVSAEVEGKHFRRFFAPRTRENMAFLRDFSFRRELAAF